MSLIRSLDIGREKAPLFSIITVTFNLVSNHRKSFFHKMMASINNQKIERQEYEHIIIDAGSKDGTTNLIEKYAKKKSVDFWLSEPDKGIYDAMNKGVSHARGEYIFFLNSDDKFHNPDVLYDIAKNINRNNPTIYLCKMDIVDTKGDKRIARRVPKLEDIFFGMPLGHQGLFIHRRCFEEIGNFDRSYKISGDYDHFWRLYNHGYAMQELDIIAADFRDDGISMKDVGARMQERDRVLMTHFIENVGLNADDLRIINDVHFNKNDISLEEFENFHSKLNKLKETPLLNQFKIRFSRRLEESDRYKSIPEFNRVIGHPENVPPSNIDLKTITLVTQRPNPITLSDVLSFLKPVNKKTLRIMRTIQHSGLFHYFHYIYKYPDVLAENFEPLAHYVLYGGSEGRTPNVLFDSKWYLEQYPSVRDAGINPLFHYIERGVMRGHAPGPSFSTTAYLRANPDVAIAGTNPLYHYLQFGAAEGRSLR